MTILDTLGWEVSPGVYVNPDAVVQHPPRGTCIPGCDLWGTCHCGCGATPTVAKRSDARWGKVLGRPYSCLRNHSPLALLALANARRSIPAPLPREAVPNKAILPLLHWLEARYGTQSAVARLLGMSRHHYHDIRNGKFTVHHPKVWRRVQAVVLAHQTPSDPFATYEERRVIPTQERAHLDAVMRRARDREAQRELRAKRRAT